MFQGRNEVREEGRERVRESGGSVMLAGEEGQQGERERLKGDLMKLLPSSPLCWVYRY